MGEQVQSFEIGYFSFLVFFFACALFLSENLLQFPKSIQLSNNFP